MTMTATRLCAGCGGEISGRRLRCLPCAHKARRERTRRNVRALRERRASSPSLHASYTLAELLPIPPADLPQQEPGWRQRAACRGAPTSLWFPDRGQTAKEARAICATCPVLESCRNWALIESGDGHGVLGGLSESDRVEYRRRWRSQVFSPPTVQAILSRWVRDNAVRHELLAEVDEVDDTPDGGPPSDSGSIARYDTGDSQPPCPFKRRSASER